MSAPTVQLSIVIPVYREADKIAADVLAARRFLLEHLGGDGEILVVDDGSPDDTAARAEALAAGTPPLRVLRDTRNHGKGHALRRGVALSRGRYVMFADAGGCVPFADALLGLRLCQHDLDLAHGSRRAAGAVVTVRQPPYRRIGSRLFWLGAKLGLGLPPGLRDTQCGFKVYRGDVARRLFADCSTDGYMIDIELVRRAHRLGLRIGEFPVHWSHDADTRYRPLRGTLRNLRELLRIRRQA